jgi:surface antigen
MRVPHFTPPGGFCLHGRKRRKLSQVLQLERNYLLRFQQLTRMFFRQPQVVRTVVKVSLVGMLGLLFVTGSNGASVGKVQAQSQSPSTHLTLQSTSDSNSFPYPQCTWWADERYHQLHGVYVPWTTTSNAWQWTDRAYQFGWSVSQTASPGAIVDLQPGVQGAYGGGHVAVVEKIYSDGSILASTTNWGSYPYQVTYVHFYRGSGVTFIQR